LQLLKKIFRNFISSVILFAGLYTCFTSILVIKEVFYNKYKLVANVGVVSNKVISIDTVMNRPKDILLLTLNNSTTYKLSKYVNFANDYLNIGDSIKIFTKPLSIIGVNFLISEDGGGLWMTENVNEVYEIFSIPKNEIIVDFSEHKQKIKKLIPFPIVVSIALLFWFIYRVKRWKSPLISER
jgi:hypothetical protein